MDISSGQFLLVFAILLAVAVMAGKVAYRLGTPALLLFLGVGLFFGHYFIDFNDVGATQYIGTVALCIILFSGGMDTKFSEIRPILAPGITLATLGVLLTASITALFIYLIAPLVGFEFSFPLALLLAATMSSTDSASVFSILRTKKQGLSENLRPLLELESGSNDPMAYVLVIVLVQMLSSSTQTPMSFGDAVGMLLLQMIIGSISGYLFGRLAVWTMNKINISNVSLYSVLLLAFVFFTFSFTSIINGNGYLAIYIAGLVVGNNRIVHKRTVVAFFDGFTWLFQIVMFLTLGLLINIEDLFSLDVLLFGLAIGVIMIIVSRPVSTILCLLPFRKFSRKARMYISWVGLRGAVPIIFATYPILADVDEAPLMLNVVFVVTILSLIIQGTSVSGMANMLGVAFEERETLFGNAMQDYMRSNFSEVAVNEQMIAHGAMLSQIALPDNTLVIMVCRDGDYFVPRGNSELHLGDRLLVLSDRNEELKTQLDEFGVENIIKP